MTSILAGDANAGSVALVTGGGTGIGRASALELARTGAVVAICGRRPDPLASVVREIEALGGQCLALPTDVREPDQVEALIRPAVGNVVAIAPAEEISAGGWRAVHRLAVDATWTVTREVATRSMIPNRRGVVIFVGFSPRRGAIRSAPARVGLPG